MYYNWRDVFSRLNFLDSDVKNYNFVIVRQPFAFYFYFITQNSGWLIADNISNLENFTFSMLRPANLMDTEAYAVLIGLMKNQKSFNDFPVKPLKT